MLECLGLLKEELVLSFTNYEAGVPGSPAGVVDGADCGHLV